eukprot:TRINITY_DN5193_c0_g2_i3.p3 TRINITY_DN5193_c0_g2~~TRINITY_DN5193_c0_g2_i3.p3  ORF type:complete len:118 (-),score=13.70 TRINITY_DN5193_c0_g2_i3:637-990(-)
MAPHNPLPQDLRSDVRKLRDQQLVETQLSNVCGNTLWGSADNKMMAHRCLQPPTTHDIHFDMLATTNLFDSSLANAVSSHIHSLVATPEFAQWSPQELRSTTDCFDRCTRSVCSRNF